MASVRSFSAASASSSELLSLTLDAGLWALEKQALTPGEARQKQSLWAFYSDLSPPARKRVRARAR